jgi:ubiquinone/menaquinone biosynthesis C-methylase UbiE
VSELPFTGERFIPGTRGEIWIEHWHRYHFAARWVTGKRVLDVACGEGYGSALLARSAAHVTGVDLAPAAIEHARRAYAHAANVEFACASCIALPLAEASVDVAVSFETLEHIAEQEQFLDELARVLAPGGVLVLSCPNKLEYSDKRHFANEFHVKELYREELAALVERRFAHCHWYGQRPTFFSLIAPEGGGRAAAQLVEIDEAHPESASERLESPLYFVLVASRERSALAAVEPVLSVLADRTDWVHRDYEKVMRDLEGTAERARSLETQHADGVAIIGALQEELRAAQAARSGLVGELRQSGARLAEREAELAVRDALLSEREREIERRRGWKWWLRLPLVRLGILR